MKRRKRYTPNQKAAIVLEVLREERSISQIASEYGVHPNLIYKWKKEGLENFHEVYEDHKQEKRVIQEQHQAEKENLYAQIGRLTTQVNWLKKNLALTTLKSERKQMIEKKNEKISLKEQATLLSLSRSGLYYQQMGPSPKEIAIKHRIDEIFTCWPFYGSRRITAVLRKEMTISRKTVQKYMREMGLEAIGPRPNLSKPHPQHKIYPYLLRNITADYPNHIWGIDITYIRLQAGWMYLVAVIDWHSRFVISWVLDQSLAVDFVLEAVDQAIIVSQPKIWNSDQGSQFTNKQYIDRLETHDIQISMDGRGRALDNAFTERLWRSVKYEEVYLNDYRTPRDARTGLTNYFEFYNYHRPHQSLQYKTPAEVYLAGENIVQLSQIEMEDSTLF